MIAAELKKHVLDFQLLIFYPENMGDKTTYRVYVGNLGNSGVRQELEKEFGRYGPIQDVWVARNPPGFAFIEFFERRDAEDAVYRLNGKRVCGVNVRVEMSRGSGGGGGGGGGGSGRGRSSRSESSRFHDDLPSDRDRDRDRDRYGSSSRSRFDDRLDRDFRGRFDDSKYDRHDTFDDRYRSLIGRR